MAIAAEKTLTERLRDELKYLVKSTRGTGRRPEDLDKEAARSPYREGVKLCLERSRLVTASYRETEGEPMVLRRAKALANVLDKMTVYINPHDRIVGNIASDHNSLTHYPELFWRWLDRLIDKEYKVLLEGEEQREELHQIHKYWRNISVQGKERNLLPEEVKPYWDYRNHGAFYWMHGARAGVPNYDKVLRIGLKGIIEEAEDRLKEIATDPDTYLDSKEYLKQKRFLDAAIISLNAATRFAKRYAEKAREMSEEEKDEGRKKELAEIAEICDWVPENPARTFREALQSYFFIILISRFLELQVNGSGERVDQFLFPFYNKDKEEGRVTREQAQELLEFLWLKLNEVCGILTPPGWISGGISVANPHYVTIGGVTTDGRDATNELTDIVIDATKKIKLVVPHIIFRYHSKIPKEKVFKVMELLRVAAGTTAFFNDGMLIPHLSGLGIPLEAARDYGIEGCMRWILPGKAMGHRNLGGMFALPRCLELALNKGIDKYSGKRIGYPTADPLSFTSIEHVIQAYLEQVRFFTEKLVTIYNTTDVIDEELTPQPFLSALSDGCIEHGRDHREYKYFPKTVIQPVGQTTVTNSLAVIKKLVFEDRKVSMAELLGAVKDNWEGKEALQRMCINEVPKFGNDDDYVDLIGKDVIQRTTETIHSFRNIYGGRIMCDGTGGASYYSYSGLTGATPDGRKDRDLFNDGTVSPEIGTDLKGPTAVLNSVGKIDHVGTFTHLFNQKFLPVYLGEEYNEMFASYIKTWADLGIHHIQFNVTDREILLKAQQHTEEYSNLVVRVAGFCAYFVDLDKPVQDQIIARTEQMFT